ncbi:MAG: DUF1559 domain-containing protein [Pirellulales bacterium]
MWSTVQVALAPGLSDEGRSDYSRPPRLADVDDGLSNTLLVVEQAGKPNYVWRPFPDYHLDLSLGPWLTCEWAFFSEEPVNTINASGIYAFHPSVAQVLLCDGSVRAMSEATPHAVYLSLVSRSGGEVIRDQDWQ